MEYYNKATEQDFIDVMKMFATREEQYKQCVFMTGLEDMLMLDLSMQEIKLPKRVNYTTTSFEKFKGFLYLNIGKKHDNTKIWININKKTYTAIIGTIKIGIYNNVENAIKALKLDKKLYYI